MRTTFDRFTLDTDQRTLLDGAAPVREQSFSHAWLDGGDAPRLATRCLLMECSRPYTFGLAMEDYP